MNTPAKDRFVIYCKWALLLIQPDFVYGRGLWWCFLKDPNIFSVRNNNKARYSKPWSTKLHFIIESAMSAEECRGSHWRLPHNRKPGNTCDSKSFIAFFSGCGGGPSERSFVGHLSLDSRPIIKERSLPADSLRNEYSRYG
ncbi:hypothetical protein CDAR_264971 [Caerostris darwini]|uniref:Ycf15 n=1 Tax=Caerostris darwini TaxID=1538125 RepID=A0AAV4W5H1_9ARAC|nr:hypothetical protein CDAR_264971 [Caerostris darwini]